jgi:hypothetical protein
VFWCILAGWLWLGVSVSAVLISLLAVRWATIGHPSEPVTVIPDGEQPEPLEDFQRVELTWTLAPGLSGVEGFIALWIRKARLAEFRDANPHKMWAGDLPKYDWYVDNGICDEINTLADRLTAVSRQRGLTKYLEVCLVLNLVQRIRYAYDQDSKGIAEYWRFPLETLADGCGDCEDFAILAVALLSAMGHETCFFDLPGHVATGVAALPEETGVSFEATDGKRFFFVETTAEGWHIGELPNDITRDSVRVAAVVAPLRGRQSDRTLQSVPSGQWRIDGKVLLRAWLIVGLAGSALSLGLHWVSIVS